MRCILLGHLASSGVGSGHFCRARPRLCLEALLPLGFCEEAPKAAGAVAYRALVPAPICYERCWRQGSPRNRRRGRWSTASPSLSRHREHGADGPRLGLRQTILLKVSMGAPLASTLTAPISMISCWMDSRICGSLTMLNSRSRTICGVRPELPMVNASIDGF